MFSMVVVGEGVGIMCVGSAADHKSLLLLIVARVGGEGVGIMFDGSGSVHWSVVTSLTSIVVMMSLLRSKTIRFAVCQVGSEKGFAVTFGLVAGADV